MYFRLIQPVYAVSTKVDDPLEGRFTTLSSIFGFFLNILIGVGWVLVFIMLAVGFIQFILSRGDSKAADKARNTIIYSLVGGVGLLLLGAVRFILPGLLGASPNIGPPEITNFWVY